MNKEIHLFKILKDLCNGISCDTKGVYVGVFLASIVAYIFYVQHINPQESQLNMNFLTVFTTTLGFSVTGYTIIMGFSSTIIDKMTQHNESGAGFFESVCATFIFSMLIQVLTIFSFLFGDIFNTKWYNSIPFAMSILSLWSLLDIIISLYTLRTLFNPKRK